MPRHYSIAAGILQKTGGPFYFTVPTRNIVPADSPAGNSCTELTGKSTGIINRCGAVERGGNAAISTVGGCNVLYLLLQIITRTQCHSVSRKYIAGSIDYDTAAR